MENNKTPSIRFKGFTDPWEQRKLGDVASSFDYGLNAAATEYDGQNKYLRITDIDDETHEFSKSDLTTPLADLAMSADYFRDLLSASSNADITNEKAERLDGKNLYLAAGEYELVKNDAGIKMDYTSYNSSVDIYIEGGYDPESTGGDLSKRDTKRSYHPCMANHLLDSQRNFT